MCRLIIWQGGRLAFREDALPLQIPLWEVYCSCFGVQSVHNHHYKGIPHVLEEVSRFLDDDPWAPVAVLPGARGHNNVGIDLRKPPLS
jgi:hypothetical protein